MALLNTTLRADRYRIIAAEVRSASGAITFPDSRATMLRLAQAYDDEAERLERLSSLDRGASWTGNCSGNATVSDVRSLMLRPSEQLRAHQRLFQAAEDCVPDVRIDLASAKTAGTRHIVSAGVTAADQALVSLREKRDTLLAEIECRRLTY